jgi:MFS family permease
MTGGEIIPVLAKALPVLKPAGSWLGRKLRPDTSASALDTIADDLSEKVKKIERERLDELQVPHGLAIPVHFDDLVHIEAPESATMSGTLSSVAPFYQGLGNPKRMIVVGEPGSGKTVLILHLILDLLEVRKDPRDPVPVRFNATAWDGRSSLLGFLAERLNAEYSIPRPVARALVESKRIVPVIDGLDEMDATGEVPRHAIEAVNRFNEPSWKTYPLVVTCRRRVYETILTHRDGAGISSSAPLGMKPLQTIEIVKHVQNRIRDTGVGASYTRALQALIERLEINPSGPLGVALQTPWMLTLTMSYLDNADPGHAATLIQADSEEAIADQLFAAQIPLACAHQPGPSDEWLYSPAQVQRWMRTFAGFVSQIDKGQRRTEVSLDQLWFLAGWRRTRLLHRLVFGLLGGLVVGLMYVLVFGLTTGLSTGLVVGLMVGLMSSKHPRPQRIYFRTHRKNELRTRLARALTSGLAAGLVSGLVTGLATGLLSGLAAGLLFGLVSGLLSGLAAGLVVGLMRIPMRFRTPQDANRVIHDDLVSGLVTALMAGLMAGLLFGLLFGPEAVLVTGLAAELAAVLAIGLMFGLITAASAGRYSCAVVIFRRSGLFAPRPAKFLEWSTHAGLLRITGTSYQLRHDTYRQWLLTHPVPEGG